MRGEHAARRVESGQDVVFEDLLDDFLGRLVSVLGDLLEGLVDGDEDGDVALGAVQQVDDVGEVVDEGGELLGEVGGLDGLVDGQVRGAVMAGQADMAVPRLANVEDVVEANGVVVVIVVVDMIDAGKDAVKELMCVLLEEVEGGVGRRAYGIPPCRRCCLGLLGFLLG